jgi:hypothetical protein
MEVDDLLRELRQSEASHDLHPVATADDLAATEAALNQRLPESFRAFLRDFSNGAYLFGVQEVSSVGSVEHPVPIHKNEWHYGSAAKADADELIPIRDGGAALYSSLIPFSLDSNGNEWCFIIDAAKPEPSVAYFSSPLSYEVEDRRLYAPLSGGFSEWLGILVRCPTDEVIRTIYIDDEDVLYDELMLG